MNRKMKKKELESAFRDLCRQEGYSVSTIAGGSVYEKYPIKQFRETRKEQAREAKIMELANSNKHLCLIIDALCDYLKLEIVKTIPEESKYVAVAREEE